MTKKTIVNFMLFIFFSVSILLNAQDYYPYDGQVNYDVKRDRIIAISADYATLNYYCGPDNVIPQCTGVTVPDTVVGWKTGTKYCWGGENTTKQYLQGLAVPLSAGNKDTSSSSSYGKCAVGADCSGMASNAWTSPRRSTSTFPGISVNILWENLRMGDCTNYPASHIRIFDYYVSNSGQLMFYESTAGTGQWRALHRPLPRDNNYQPIRYNNPSGQKVYDFPEPTITYIKQTGIERVEVRWDGQADTGFRLYQSTGGTNWTLIRNESMLTSPMRHCEVSGLIPDKTYFYKMTAVNTGGETINSAVVPYRYDGYSPRVLLVDGADRYRVQFNANHNFLTRVGTALATRGIGFDFCSNEAIVDEQISLNNYKAVVWTLAEEATFDETFSWPEQMHLTNFLQSGGCLFVSGSEIAWDLDLKANDTTYKNGHVNDRPFYKNYLLASYIADDANSYRVQGLSGSIFQGLDFYFDNGTRGTYDVKYPDVIQPYNGGLAGLNYVGGTGGVACVYGSPVSNSKIVNMGFGFETIYPDTARTSVMSAIFKYFDIQVRPPTIKSVIQTAVNAVTITWEGHASTGFRLFQKTGDGTWTLIKNETVLGPDSRSTQVSGLSPFTRYAFKLKAVNSSGASADSDVLCCALSPSGPSIIIVDGYDRWNAQAQSGGNNHTLIEKFADSLSANNASYNSCTNEAITEGLVSLSNYNIVIWMCGEEATESETFSEAEQLLLQNFLEAGGKLFVSGAEIGWDLVFKGGSANEYSNGSPNDTPFFRNYLKADYVADDANTYNVRGVSGSIFAGLSFSFDDGTRGIYNAEYPDVISPYGGSSACLYYGTSGTNVAGVVYSGPFGSGTAEGKVILIGFPFETIYDFTARTSVMQRILNFFSSAQPTPTITPSPTPTPTPILTPTPTTTPSPTPTPTPIQVISYDFEIDTDGWTFTPIAINTYDIKCTGATSVFDGHRIGITTDNNTNRFGWWSAPSAIPSDPNRLFKFAWKVNTSQSVDYAVPVFRFRINEVTNSSYSLEMIQTSVNGSGSPPTTGERTYNQYVRPLAAGDLLPTFDVYDFDPVDYGTVYLTQLDVTKTNIPTTDWSTLEVPGFMNWSFVNGPGIYNNAATSGQSASSLQIGFDISEDRGFAYWVSPGMYWAPGKLHRAIFTLSSASGPNTFLGAVGAGSADYNWFLRCRYYAPIVPDADGNNYTIFFETTTGPQFYLVYEGMDFENTRGGINVLTNVLLEERNIMP